jgi:hypothetical protein
MRSWSGAIHVVVHCASARQHSASEIISAGWPSGKTDAEELGPVVLDVGRPVFKGAVHLVAEQVAARVGGDVGVDVRAVDAAAAVLPGSSPAGARRISDGRRTAEAARRRPRRRPEGL